MTNTIKKEKVMKIFNLTSYVADLIVNATNPVAKLEYIVMMKLSKTQISELY